MAERLHYDSNDRDDGEIESCPCCGGNAFAGCWTPPFRLKPTYYYVVCEDCHLMTQPYGESVKQAIADWNRRPNKNRRDT